MMGQTPLDPKGRPRKPRRPASTRRRFESSAEDLARATENLPPSLRDEVIAWVNRAIDQFRKPGS